MRRCEAALLLCLVAAPAAFAQAPVPASPSSSLRPHPEFLVGTAWLAARLDSPGVVILHVGRSDSLYRSGHVPGARYLPLAAVATAIRGIPNEFPPESDLAATFRDVGVGNTARIVLYGDDAGLLAARAWVALDVLGQGARASLLDGGFAKWTAEHRPVETGLHPPTPGPFTARWHGERIAGAQWVRAHLRDSAVVFVDARPAAPYAGVEPPCPAGSTTCVETPVERRGHLPGAWNLWWMENLVSRDDPILKPPQQLEDEWAQRTGAGRPGTRTVVTYCHSGMQASYAYFVARYLGHADVRLYDGSWAEWAALAPAASYPVERSAP